MSNVIQLGDKRRGRKPVAKPAGATAEIVIFHGVRIERLTDDMVQVSVARNNLRLPSHHNQATATELE